MGITVWTTNKVAQSCKKKYLEMIRKDKVLTADGNKEINE